MPPHHAGQHHIQSSPASSFPFLLHTRRMLNKPSPTPYPAIYLDCTVPSARPSTQTPIDCSTFCSHLCRLISDRIRQQPFIFIFIFIFITDQPSSSSSSSSCQHSTAGKPGKNPGRAVYKRISSPIVRKSSPAINKQHQSLRFSSTSSTRACVFRAQRRFFRPQLRF